MSDTTDLEWAIARVDAAPCIGLPHAVDPSIHDADAAAIGMLAEVGRELLAVAEVMPAMIDRLDHAMGDSDPLYGTNPDVEAMAQASRSLAAFLAALAEHRERSGE